MMFRTLIVVMLLIVASPVAGGPPSVATSNQKVATTCPETRKLYGLHTRMEEWTPDCKHVAVAEIYEHRAKGLDEVHVARSKLFVDGNLREDFCGYLHELWVSPDGQNILYYGDLAPDYISKTYGDTPGLFGRVALAIISNYTYQPDNAYTLQYARAPIISLNGEFLPVTVGWFDWSLRINHIQFSDDLQHIAYDVWYIDKKSPRDVYNVFYNDSTKSIELELGQPEPSRTVRTDDLNIWPNQPDWRLYSNKRHWDIISSAARGQTSQLDRYTKWVYSNPFPDGYMAYEAIMSQNGLHFAQHVVPSPEKCRDCTGEYVFTDKHQYGPFDGIKSISIGNSGTVAFVFSDKSKEKFVFANGRQYGPYAEIDGVVVNQVGKGWRALVQQKRINSWDLLADGQVVAGPFRIDDIMTWTDAQGGHLAFIGDDKKEKYVWIDGKIHKTAFRKIVGWRAGKEMFSFWGPEDPNGKNQCHTVSLPK